MKIFEPSPFRHGARDFSSTGTKERLPAIDPAAYPDPLPLAISTEVGKSKYLKLLVQLGGVEPPTS